MRNRKDSTTRIRKNKIMSKANRTETKTHPRDTANLEARRQWNQDPSSALVPKGHHLYGALFQVGIFFSGEPLFGYDASAVFNVPDTTTVATGRASPTGARISNESYVGYQSACGLCGVVEFGPQKCQSQFPIGGNVFDPEALVVSDVEDCFNLAIHVQERKLHGLGVFFVFRKGIPDAVDIFVDIIAFAKGKTEEFFGENAIGFFLDVLAGTETPCIVRTTTAAAAVVLVASPAPTAFHSQYDEHVSPAFFSFGQSKHEYN